MYLKDIEVFSNNRQQPPSALFRTTDNSVRHRSHHHVDNMLDFCSEEQVFRSSIPTGTTRATKEDSRSNTWANKLQYWVGIELRFRPLRIYFAVLFQTSEEWQRRSMKSYEKSIASRSFLLVRPKVMQ